MTASVKRFEETRAPRKMGFSRRGFAPLLGWGLLIGLIALAVTPLTFASYDPTRIVARPLSAPSPEHHLGTNDIGQDLLSELIWGTRISLTTGLVVAVGTLVGILAGYFGGWGGAC